MSYPPCHGPSISLDGRRSNTLQIPRFSELTQPKPFHQIPRHALVRRYLDSLESRSWDWKLLGLTVTKAGTAQTGGVTKAGTAKTGGVTKAGTVKTGGVTKAGTAQTGGVTKAGTAKTGGVTKAGTAKTGGATKAGTAKLEE